MTAATTGSHRGVHGVCRPGMTALLALLPLALAGCAPPLETDYGTVRGPSINGVSAFVQLLRDTGRAPTARRRLPPRIDPAVRTVVVVDDSFTGLREDAAETLERWLDGDGGHTLLLLLRDGDAAIGYLRAIIDRDAMKAAERDEARSLLASAEGALSGQVSGARTASPPFPDGLEPMARAESAAVVDVRIGVAAGGEPVRARFDRHRRLAGADGAEPLWEADGEPLLVRTDVGADEILVLATALPILNGSLVDPGNRALAEALAAALPADGELLVIGSGEVSVPDEDDEARSAWHLLGIQPLPWVALQAAVAMGMFCWYTAPILGRPRRVRQDHAQDFSHHVDALAALLARVPGTGAAFALRRIEEWRLIPPRTPAPRARGRTPP